MTPETAFSPAFSRQFFLETAGAADALQRLEAGLGAREPFLVLTGEPGSGKTTLAHEAIARWESRVAAAFLAYPALTGAELLEEIVLRFGGQPADGASRPKLVACLERVLADIAGRGQVAMIVVDDAQKLSPELLEELRLLVNAAQQAGRPLEVLLAGLPALEPLLDDPALAALRQRVSVRARLEPLPAGETRRYLRHRLDAAGADGASLFPRKACHEVARLSHGVPRRISALASEALRLARTAGEPAVQPEHVQAAAESLWGSVSARVVTGRDDAGEAEAPRIAPRPATAGAKRAAEPVASPLGDADVAPRPAPASQDPNEWVARFVGGRGPIRIGSQAMTHLASGRALSEPGAEGVAPVPAAAPALPSAPAAPLARSRRTRGGGLRAATYATLATCAVIAAVVLFVRTRGTATARSAGSVTVATSGPPGAPTTPARRTPAGTGARSAAAPAVAARADDSDRAAGSASPAAAEAIGSPTGRWTLEVASAIDLQSAFDERDRMEQLTGFEGWVIPTPDGSAEPHRIVVGIYRSRARASAAAKMLLGTRTLRSARVVPLPVRAERR